MISDQIGDLLTRIRNATLVRKSVCQVYFSHLKGKILAILKAEGYILDYQRQFLADKKRSNWAITLKYQDKISVIQGLKRISKPGLRVYVNNQNLPTVLEGIGVAIISTSAGLMTDQKAKAEKLGGEVLLFVW